MAAKIEKETIIGDVLDIAPHSEIGRASCRERV